MVFFFGVNFILLIYVRVNEMTFLIALLVTLFFFIGLDLRKMCRNYAVYENVFVHINLQAMNLVDQKDIME